MKSKIAWKNFWHPSSKKMRKIGYSLTATGTAISGWCMYEGNKTLAVITLICTIAGNILIEFTKEESDVQP